ncbi:hypothetical protein [Paenibacillus cookii]|uniref:hypothetical protein n=1 Tax=Paenibacillus cookii TaxID=157839 RepID=UPI001BB3902D|nr:hypothetical protein [Paenibacillus cookii]
MTGEAGGGGGVPFGSCATVRPFFRYPEFFLLSLPSLAFGAPKTKQMFLPGSGFNGMIRKGINHFFVRRIFR